MQKCYETTSNISKLWYSLEVDFWYTYTTTCVLYTCQVSLIYLFRHISFFGLENSYMCDANHTLNGHYSYIRSAICYVNQLSMSLA